MVSRARTVLTATTSPGQHTLIVILSAAKDLAGLRLELSPGQHTGRGNHRVVTDTVVLANQVIRSENTGFEQLKRWR